MLIHRPVRRGGVAFANGKLYEFSEYPSRILVIRPWGRPQAWMKRTDRGRWWAWHPEIDLTQWRRYAREAPRPWECRKRDAQLFLPFDPPLDRPPRRRAEVFGEALAAIPDAVRRRVQRYDRYAQWAILGLLARVPDGLELVDGNPALALCLARADVFGAHQRRWRTVRRLAGRRQHDICGALGLPARRWVARCLAKVPTRSVSLPLLGTLRRMLDEPDVTKRLWHLPRLNAGVIDLLRTPHLRRSASYGLLEQVATRRQEDRRPSTAWRLSLLLAREDGLGPSARVFRSVEQVEQRYDDLERQLETDAALRASTPLPSAPVAGVTRRAVQVDGDVRTVTIEPMTSWEDLSREGAEMGNCVGGRVWISKVLRREAFVYRMLEPERCTLAVHEAPNGWCLAEIEAGGGAVPATETVRCAEAWLGD